MLNYDGPFYSIIKVFLDIAEKVKRFLWKSDERNLTGQDKLLLFFMKF